ncbi:MAG: GLUG motif-containing protein [Candidatus Thermoplasmatota archaeon]
MMTKKILVFAVTLSLLFSAMLTVVGSEATYGKERIETKASQEIHDWYDLNDMRDNLGGNYILMSDLDENTEGYAELVDVEYGWDPIGDNTNEFTGTLDGNGYEIRDLYIFRPETWRVGLFGCIDERATVTNTALVDVDVTGYNYVGGLVASNFGTIEKSSYAVGQVIGEDGLGGLVGRNWEGGTVYDSYATGDVNGNMFVGGLVGDNNGTVSHSYATGNVNGDGTDSTSVGGLVGYNPGIVEKSNATGNVNGDGKDVGGLVGLNAGTVSNSYATGDVSGDNYVGGLVGENPSMVSNSYATGEVSGNSSLGGLVGLTIGKVESSFWDTEASGIKESNGGTGKYTKEMKNVSTYTDTSTQGLEESWDFVGDPKDDTDDENIWDIDENGTINDGYPFFNLDKEEENGKDEGFIDEILDISGFTSTLLVMAVMIAVAVYHKKKR